MRLWEPGAGTFALAADARIVAASELTDVAATFVDDLHVQLGRRFEVVRGSPRPGDIVLMLADCDARLGDEGYLLEVADQLRVTAPRAAGVFYGTRTLLQLFQQGTVIPAGRAADWPRYPERGLMVDNGRKYFTPDWLHERVRELAWLKLNYLHLHFSDDQGFRIESKRYPQIVSDDHLTQAQLQDLLDLARRYFITVVPEIDMPGHMEAALAPFPEFQLRNALGVRSAGKLDVTNPQALAFARELIEEFLPLFPGPYWHIGADEYLIPAQYPLFPSLREHAQAQYGPEANGKDAVLGFVNWANDVVREFGRTGRIWHDGLQGGRAVTVSPDLVVEWWTNISPISETFTITPQELLDQGHLIMNAGWFPTYYPTLFPDPLFLRPDMRTAYEGWTVDQFQGPFVIGQALAFPPARIDADDQRNLGSKLHVWTDIPEMESEQRIAEGIHPRLRVLAQKTWESPLLTPSYAEFLRIIDSVGNAPQ